MKINAKFNFYLVCVDCLLLSSRYESKIKDNWNKYIFWIKTSFYSIQEKNVYNQAFS